MKTNGCIRRLLGKIFHTDFQLPGANQTLGPHVADFIASVVPQLQVLKSLNTSVDAGKTGKNCFTRKEFVQKTNLFLYL